MTITIGICGYARSGKDTVANYLADRWKFNRIGLADAVRHYLEILDPMIELDQDCAQHPLEVLGRNYPKTCIRLSQALKEHGGWEGLKGLSQDIRGLMQRMGTEIGRNCIDQDWWLTEAMCARDVLFQDGPMNIVIPDVRFKSEEKYLKNNTSIFYLWRIDRPGVERPSGHSSEDLPFLADEVDFHLINDGTPEALYGRIREELERLGFTNPA
jgi:hypothetical protein